MGNITQKRQLTIVTTVAILSVIMITGITVSSLPLFDQKADALKSKSKKFSSKTSAKGDGANGANGANGGPGKNAVVIKSGSSSGPNGASGGSSSR